MPEKSRTERPFVTRFRDEIVAEVVFPRRQTGRVAILCMGAPTAPFKPKVLRFLAEKGYLAILPRYRGTWESSGEFLARSPHEDILDIIHELVDCKKLTFLDKLERRVTVKDIFLLGASFGGPAVIFASRHPKVKKAIALSPVCDFRETGPAEPFEWFYRLTRYAFGGAYRAREKNWRRLEHGKLYNPVNETTTINGQKLLFIHPLDDTVTLAQTTKRFANGIGATILLPRTGGHLGLRTFCHQRYWKKIDAFLRQR